MKIITQLVILILSLLLVNAHGENEQCTNLFKQYKIYRSKCSPSQITIDNCCELTGFPFNKTPSAVYYMTSCTAPCEVSSFASITITGYCDMTTDSGGWLVIQRNKQYSLVNFNKNWTDYEKGFGDLTTEFWYGLAAMHCLTQRGQWEMRVDYQKKDKTWSYLHYNQFSVGSSSEKYLLTVGGFTGVGSDQFRYHNNKKFTTPDNDNDDNKNGNCATQHENGWWFYNCDAININEKTPVVIGAALFTEMKIRPKGCIPQ